MATSTSSTSKYPITLVTLATRKEGVTRAAFHEHNETLYAPLLKRKAGKVHPVAWNRIYHVDESELPIGLSRLLIGSSSSADEVFDWDCMGQMTFEDELHLQQFITFMHSEEALEVLAEEEKFADPTKTKLLVMKKGGCQ
jgi:hypothetical protein